MSEASLNRRRFKRVNVRMKIRISTIDPESDPVTGKPFFRTSEETCANVSRGGAFVATPEPVTPGRRLLLEVEIPDGGTLQAIGRVAWSKTVLAPSDKRPESGIGVEFLGGTPEQFTALEEYLARSTRRAARTRRAPPPQPPLTGGSA
jgi:Tfp pilus assembly protein PilZ